MAITLDTIRSFSGNDRILLDQTGTQLQSVNKWQRFKSFFNIGHARQENQTTLDALRTAIQNDPRYFADDVKARATALLDGSQTDHAISISQIRSIIDELDAMSNPGKRLLAAQERVAGRLAAIGVPDFAQGFAQNYATLAKVFVTDSAPLVTTGGEQIPDYKNVNIAQKLRDFEVNMRSLFDILGNDPDGKAILGENCVDILRDGNKHFRQPQDCVTRILALKGNMDELRQLEAQHGPQMRPIILSTIRGAHRSLPPGLITTAVQRAAAIPTAGLAALSGDSSLTEIFDALKAFSEAAMRQAAIPNTHDPYVLDAIRDLVCATAISAMPAEAKAHLLDALQSDNAGQLRAFLNQNGRTLPTYRQMAHFAAIMDEQTRVSLNRQNEPAAPTPEQYDASRFPLKLLASTSASNFVTGSVAPLTSERLDTYFDTPDDLKAFLNRSSTQQMTISIPELMSDKASKTCLGTFDEDLTRGWTIQLPGGQTIPPNPKVAHDMLTQFVTGDPAAKFETASESVKNQAKVLMSCLHQAIPGIALAAMGEACDEKHKRPVLAASEETNDRQSLFVLSKDATTGDVTIAFSQRQSLNMCVRLEGNNPSYTFLNPDKSYSEVEMTIKIPNADLKKFGDAPWSQYDYPTVQKEENRATADQRQSVIEKYIPETYRFTGTMETLVHLHMVEKDKSGAAAPPATA